MSEQQEFPRILQMASAAGWYIKDINGEYTPVVAFALYEGKDDDGKTIRDVEPLVAFDDVIELPSFPYTLKHESEIVQ